MEEIEIWKSLDFLGYPNYEVSNFGRVKSLNYRRSGKDRILKPYKKKNGYLEINLYENGKAKTFTVHKLVCLAFLKNDYNLPCINHKDENKENNHVDNLEWCTQQFNINYGTRNQRVGKKNSLSLKGKYVGENHPMYGKHHTEETKRKLSKAILQYTLDGVFVKEWNSIRQAQEELKLNHITAVCNGKRNKCGEYVWRYKE